MNRMRRNAIQELVTWKSSEDRKPMVLKGARQVGKTWLMKEFGQNYYDSYVYFNFDEEDELKSIFEANKNPQRIIELLSLIAGEKILPEKTLIIFDEIQECPEALNTLKYFKEKANEYHVIAAGSLLGTLLAQPKSYPVGMVNLLDIYPLTFDEFLEATDESLYAYYSSIQKEQPIEEIFHNRLLEAYNYYLIIGGMPACINAFLKSGSFLDVPLVQSEILDNYIADMAKYASNTDSVKIRACYNSIPAQLAKDNRKFQYKVVQKGGSASLFGASIEWLYLAGVVLKCQSISQAFEPISVYADLSAFKLYMGDVGLLTAKSGLSQQTVLSGEGNTFMGAVTENYVAQQLAANGHDLYYWESNNTAELDFVLQRGNQVMAIEVKKGEHVRSRSLNLFISTYHPSCAIRLSLKNFGEKDGLKSVPLYAAFCI